MNRRTKFVLVTGGVVSSIGKGLASASIGALMVIPGHWPASGRNGPIRRLVITINCDGHPLLGRRMPDLDLDTADGPTRVFTLLHDARPVLLNLGEPGGFDISPWAHRVWLVDAEHDGVWELPILGEIAAPPAVLIAVITSPSRSASTS